MCNAGPTRPGAKSGKATEVVRVLPRERRLGVGCEGGHVHGRHRFAHVLGEVRAHEHAAHPRITKHEPDGSLGPAARLILDRRPDGAGPTASGGQREQAPRGVLRPAG